MGSASLCVRYQALHTSRMSIQETKSTRAAVANGSQSARVVYSGAGVTRKVEFEIT